MPALARVDGSALLRVGQYHIGARLGVGAAGAVFAALHDAHEIPLAIKLMLPEWAGNDQMVRRFEREIETLQALDHPNVVRILDHGRLDDGRLWYVMPRLEGTDLDALLSARGRLALDEALAVMDAVCAALVAAHGCGVIHRDLKASNVFVGPEQPPSITLFDFGAARVDTSARGKGLTVAGHIIGTPTSMAPEQIVGFDPDVRTDVYAAGVLLFRMITGRYPFQGGTTEEIMMSHLSAPPPRASDFVAVPASIERVIMRCLEKRMEDRYADAAELAAALREMTTGAPVRGASEVQAIAIHVDLVAPEAIVDEYGLDALELTATRLIEGGFELALGVGGSVLGVAPIVGAPQAAVVDASNLAVALFDEILRLVHPQLDPRIVIHVGDAELHGTFLEGELAEIDAWASSELAAGIHFSASARAVASTSPCDGESQDDRDEGLAGDASGSDRRAVA